MESNTENEISEVKKEDIFKKPAILIGKVGKLPRKQISTENVSTPEEKIETTETESEKIEENIQKLEIENEVPKEKPFEKDENVRKEIPQPKNIACPYVEPDWSGLPIGETDFTLEVLKSGVSIENINLMSKKYWVVGRQPTCDISLAHPTISRNHAVIQYKSIPSEDMPCGFYIYDLESTHGTFLNKSLLKPKIHARIQVGHMLKFGASTRTFLLNGPDEDKEEESELTLTELKQKRLEELREREEKERQEAELQRLEKEKKEKEEEERGNACDWGMGEDADEETDLSVNPYAETTNEQLYIDDPKKALRGFFEREGFDLQYECNEQGFGQFRCTVELPIDDANGRPIMAEAIVKGKKKEAVVQCALEACRILDRHGVLRQATHESRKRKARNWEENDYYDSDEDTFLDRTGTIEKKREKRMKAKQQRQPETYQTLLVKEKDIADKIKSLETQLDKLHEAKLKKSEDADGDSLDSFMKELAEPVLDKYAISKIKNELNQLRKEHSEVIKLVNLTRPANLPPLLQPNDSKGLNINLSQQKKQLPMFGKRFKVKVMLPNRNVPSSTTQVASDLYEENEDEEEEEENNIEKKEIRNSLEKTNGTTEKPDQATEKLEYTSKKPENLSNKSESPTEKTDCTTENPENSSEAINMNSSASAPDSSASAPDSSASTLDSSVSTPSSCVSVPKSSPYASNPSASTSRSNASAPSSSANAPNSSSCAANLKAPNPSASSPISSANAPNSSPCIHNPSASASNPSASATSSSASATSSSASATSSSASAPKSSARSPKPSARGPKPSASAPDPNAPNHNTSALNTSANASNPSTSAPSSSASAPNPSPCVPNPNASAPNPGASASNPSGSAPNSSNKKSHGLELNDEICEDLSQKSKKKNLRRIIQRQEKAEHEKQKLYQEDASKAGYDMWVPPDDQTGDGRTSLNDKFGY